MPGSVLAQEIKKRDPFTSQAEEVYLNLLRTHAFLSAPSEQLFKAHGISQPKYNILRILRRAVGDGEGCEHGLPSLEIADRMITRVPDITRLVDGLIDDNLVNRRRCTEDRRVVYVGITQKGLNLLEKLDKPIAESHTSILSHLTAEELLEFNRLLVKARKANE
jgi:DNA-binding MarR family transcriptional regulator